MRLLGLSPLGQLATSLISLVSRRVMGVRTCESRCLFSGSKGEVCCIEPLHAKVELRDHPITQYSLLAMASLTKVTCCLQKALCELCEKSPRNKILLYLLYTQMFYFVFMFFLKILVIGLKPSLKVWMTFPYGRVSNEAKCFLNYGHKLLEWRGWGQDQVLILLLYWHSFNSALGNYSAHLLVWRV